MLANPSLLVARLRGRATCVLGQGAKLSAGARIVNMRPHSHYITIGAHTVVQGELLTFRHGGGIRIGDWCFVGPNTRIWSGAEVRIGNHVLVAHNVSIMDNQTHPIQANERRRHFAAIVTTGHPEDIDLGDRPVLIEDDVWIGASAIILRGVTIATRSIVAAGSVVTRDVPPDCMVAGNPARVIREMHVSPCF